MSIDLVKVASRLEKELDGFGLETWKCVNRPRYLNNETSAMVGRAKEVHTKNEVIKRAIWRKKERHQSYAQEVKEGEKSSKNISRWDSVVIQQPMEWLTRSFADRVHSYKLKRDQV